MKRLLLVAPLLFAPRANASVDASAPSPSCTVKGKLKMAVPVYAAGTGNVELLTFSNLERNVETLEFPKDTATGRIRTRSSRDVPGLRVDGWVAGKTFTFSTTKDQPVVTNHVWLTAGASLRLFQTPKALEGDAFESPFASTRARVECSDLKFGTAALPSKPKGSWLYFKNKTTKLLDSPAGKPVFTLQLQVELDAVDVIVTKTQGTFSQIEIVDVVKVSGWVASSDLKDQPYAGGGGIGALGGGGIGTVVSKQPTYTAKFDTDVYLAPSAGGQVAATLEKDAQVYATPVANGYSQITLVNRDAYPPDGKSFYVQSTALQP
jgi:hypothetical protein